MLYWYCSNCACRQCFGSCWTLYVLALTIKLHFCMYGPLQPTKPLQSTPAHPLPPAPPLDRHRAPPPRPVPPLPTPLRLYATFCHALDRTEPQLPCYRLDWLGFLNVTKNRKMGFMITFTLVKSCAGWFTARTSSTALSTLEIIS